MLYEPIPYFSVVNALGGAAINTVVMAASDFIAQDNKPWLYYAGAFTGHAVAATGIPGAAAGLYVIGETLEFTVLQGRNSGQVQVYLDGILAVAVDNFVDATDSWAVQSVAMVPNAWHRVDIVNAGVSTANPGGISWLALSTFSLTGAQINAQRNFDMAQPILVSFGIQDGKGDVNSLVVYLPAATAVSDALAFGTAFSTLVDAVLDSKVVSGSIALPVTLGTIKASPVTASDVQEGGLLGYTAAGTNYRSTFRLPGIGEAFVSGKSVLTTGAMATLIAAFISGLTPAGTLVTMTDKYGNDLTALESHVKSFRKK